MIQRPGNDFRILSGLYPCRANISKFLLQYFQLERNLFNSLLLDGIMSEIHISERSEGLHWKAILQIHKKLNAASSSYFNSTFFLRLATEETPLLKSHVDML